MANVSSSNGLEKRPKLRFPGFNEPYKQCRIGDIYAERSQRGASGMELLSVTMNDGVMPRSEIEGKDNSSEDKSNYKIVRKGDMVYNSMRMWQGANGISPCDGIVSPAYTVLMPKQEISNGYFAALFKSANLINEFRKNSQGMTSDTWNLKYPQIKTIKVLIPSVSEQEKVSELFSVLDARIAAQAQLVEALKKYKRGLLQVIFDDNTVDLFGEVKQSNFVKLSDILIFQNGINADSSKYGQGRKYISVSDILKNDFITYEQIVGLIDIDDITLEKYSVTYGDVLFQRSSETREDAGRSNVYLDKIHTATFGGFVIRGKKKAEYNPLYLKYALDSTSVRKQIMKCAAGAQHINVSQDDLSNVIVNLPDMKIQDDISCFISHLDNRMNFISQQKKHYQLLRTALLQQLFI